MFEGFYCPEAEIDLSDPAQNERQKELFKSAMNGSDLSMEDALWLDAWNLAAMQQPS